MQNIFCWISNFNLYIASYQIIGCDYIVLGYNWLTSHTFGWELMRRGITNCELIVRKYYNF